MKLQLMYSLYRHCQTRTNTSKQIFNGVVKDLALFIASPQIADECVEIIRPYKNSGTNLESTVDALCSALGEGRWV